MLLNVTKSESYSFYRFRVIKEKPTEEVNLPLDLRLPSPPLLGRLKLNNIKK